MKTNKILYFSLFVFVSNCLCAFNPSSTHDTLHSLLTPAIEKGLIPGAVVCFVSGDSIAYLGAFGNRAIVPKPLPMRVNTRFDMASCSKVMATGSVTLQLIARGDLKPTDTVKKYLPKFKSNATIADLVRHTSGLPGYFNVTRLDSLFSASHQFTKRQDYLIDTICMTRRPYETPQPYLYSCLNYITLQAVLETISHQPFNQLAKQEVFKPLKMKHTGYKPKNKHNIAPTERKRNTNIPSEHTQLCKQSECWHGVVHDPLARVMMNGVSGNAGVFSNAQDVAKWCVWMLNLDSTTLQNGLYAGLRPEKDGRSHTGYTGTLVRLNWERKQAVILLTNRVHPDDKGNLKALRKAVYEVFIPKTIIQNNLGSEIANNDGFLEK